MEDQALTKQIADTFEKSFVQLLDDLPAVTQAVGKSAAAGNLNAVALYLHLLYVLAPELEETSREEAAITRSGNVISFKQ